MSPLSFLKSSSITFLSEEVYRAAAGWYIGKKVDVAISNGMP